MSLPITRRTELRIASVEEVSAGQDIAPRFRPIGIPAVLAGTRWHKSAFDLHSDGRRARNPTVHRSEFYD